VNYTSVNPFDSETWFEDDGTLTVRYLNYDDDPLPVNITKRYAMVPDENFLVVEYTFDNLTSSPRTMNLLEQVHLTNKTWGAGTVEDQEGWFDGSRNTLGADMSASGQYHIQLGAFQAMDSYQVADDANSNPAASTSSGWSQFDANGVLNNNGNLFTEDLSLSFQDEVVVPANGSATRAFYYVIESTKALAEAASDVARAQTAAYWFADTADSYEAWLGAGVAVDTSDEGLDTAYIRSQVINKQSQHPTFGNWPAATNIPYEYKVWVRDAAVTAMAMDATGHREDARKYWEWMASVQDIAGNYTTNYSIWHPNQPISFVEPEEDDLGLFLMGVYRHYELTAAENATEAADFLDDVWDAVEGAADYVVNNLETNDFGPRDASIWEEGIEFNTFTQVLYVHGLEAASILATEAGESALAATYENTAGTIRDAVLRSFNDSPRGLWNDSNQYFNRAVNTDGSARDTIDGSSNLIWVFGLLDADDPRVRDHRTKTIGRLTNDDWGIARYEGDEFYHSSVYSPGGQYEAAAAEPVWPQMSMYAALLDHWAGRDDEALARLQWFVSRTGRGFVTPGEPVDWVTGLPLVSTMIEPVTGAWYQLALLNYVDEFDPRMPE
jgi:GH15 family glucan-1,4-alpha-glucosidase